VTVVAAIARDGKVYVGADSCASGDGIEVSVSTPKITRIGNMVVGFAGSWSVGRRVFKYLEKSMDLEKLVEGLDTRDDDEWSLLIARDGKIFEVSGSDRSIVEIRPNDNGVAFYAIGSAQAIALGALYSDHKRNSQSVTNALEAAVALTNGVRAPFTLITL